MSDIIQNLKDTIKELQLQAVKDRKEIEELKKTIDNLTIKTKTK